MGVGVGVRVGALLGCQCFSGGTAHISRSERASRTGRTLSVEPSCAGESGSDVAGDSGSSAAASWPGAGAAVGAAVGDGRTVGAGSEPNSSRTHAWSSE